MVLLALIVIVFTLLQIRIDDGSIQKAIKVWPMILTNKLKAITTEASTAKDELTALQIEAQKTYDMAQTAINKLKIQQEELLLLKNSSAAKMADTNNSSTGKGGNP